MKYYYATALRAMCFFPRELCNSFLGDPPVFHHSNKSFVFVHFFQGQIKVSTYEILTWVDKCLNRKSV